MANRNGSYWRNPVIAGPVIAAGLAAVGATVLWYLGYIFPDLDHIPPNKPNIVEITTDSAKTGAEVLFVKYEDAEDNQGGSGLKEVRLWYRYLREGEWVETESARTRANGEIRFSDLQGSGFYSFDLVSVDQQGNRSALPIGTDGQMDFRLGGADISFSVDSGSADPEKKSEILLAQNTNFVKKQGWIDIPVHFHVIHDGLEGNIKESDIHEQLAVLNRAFFNGKISFILRSIDRTSNAGWFQVGSGSAAETVMKKSLVRAPAEALNVYTNNGGGLLGWSNFPSEFAASPETDGVTILYTTLPGSEVPPYNLGHVLVGRVGNWLGLFHTFQGGCSPPGDFVEDTVAHSGPNYGKPEVGLNHNACNPSETAPVKNFMNYVDDDWMDHFTPGQFTRMKENIVTFRSGLLD